MNQKEKKAPAKKAPAKKQKEKGVGAKLIGNPSKFIEKIIADRKSSKWVTDQLVNEGPPHKQLMNALLLKHLAAFVTSVEKSTGTDFNLKKGRKLVSHHHEHTTHLPLDLVPEAFKPFAKNKKAFEKMTGGPEHELVLYTMLLQVLDWASEAIL